MHAAPAAGAFNYFNAWLQMPETHPICAGTMPVMPELLLTSMSSRPNGNLQAETPTKVLPAALDTSNAQKLSCSHYVVLLARSMHLRQLASTIRAANTQEQITVA
jgi:hypothetical protein